MLDEITKDIKATLYDRIASPFTGSLIISWIYWNWEIVVVLFFDKSEYLGHTKVDYISTFLFSQNSIFWFPLVSAIGITLIYPLVSTATYWFWQVFQSIKRKIKLKSEDKVPLDIEESIELRLLVRRMQQKFHESNETNSKLIEKLQDENKNYKEEVLKMDSYERKNKSLQDENRDLIRQHSETVNLNKGLTKEIQDLVTKNEELSRDTSRYRNQKRSLIENVQSEEALKTLLDIKSDPNISLESYSVDTIELLIAMDLIDIHIRSSGRYPKLSNLGLVILGLLNIQASQLR